MSEIYSRYIVGDVRDVLGSLPDASVDCIITSPPYFNLRSYVPAGHSHKAAEFGQEPTPGAFIEALLTLMDDLWRVLKDDGTYWVNLGDSHAGSGGSGGDYNKGGMREGQARWMGTARSAREASAKIPWRGKRPGYPMDQSVCWTPHLFGASLAYGRNLLTGQDHRQWVTRPPVTWCKPNPAVGELTRRFKTGTELIVYGGKHRHHYFNLDAVRTSHTEPIRERVQRPKRTTENGCRGEGGDDRGYVLHTGHPLGVPPLNWWVVAPENYKGAHYAVFPPELIFKPVICGCPPGGTVLDPFAGSGTTLSVALGNGRSSIGIDLDSRNADLARERVGPMFLTVEQAGEVETFGGRPVVVEASL